MAERKHGLKIVRGKKEPMASPGFALNPSKIPNTRIQRDGLIADILVSRTSSGSIFHYVIQQEGCAEILIWGQELSMENALQAVDEYLESSPLRETNPRRQV
jgi:hypothetical protein